MVALEYPNPRLFSSFDLGFISLAGAETGRGEFLSFAFLRHVGGEKAQNAERHALPNTSRTGVELERPPFPGRLFLFGGYDAEGNFLNDLWVLRPWEPRGAPESAGTVGSSVLLWSDRAEAEAEADGGHDEEAAG